MKRIMHNFRGRNSNDALAKMLRRETRDMSNSGEPTPVISAAAFESRQHAKLALDHELPHPPASRVFRDSMVEKTPWERSRRVAV